MDCEKFAMILLVNNIFPCMHSHGAISLMNEHLTGSLIGSVDFYASCKVYVNLLVNLKNIKTCISVFILCVCIENVSGCCIVTESDTDLEVEYQDCGNGRAEAGGLGAGDGESPSDSNTVNQDEDSFSILDGDSLLEVEGPQPEMPPLFVHLTCSVNMKSCHGSMPTQTLPTCLGETLNTPLRVLPLTKAALYSVCLQPFNRILFYTCCI